MLKFEKLTRRRAERVDDERLSKRAYKASRRRGEKRGRDAREERRRRTGFAIRECGTPCKYANATTRIPRASEPDPVVAIDVDSSNSKNASLVVSRGRKKGVLGNVTAVRDAFAQSVRWCTLAND